MHQLTRVSAGYETGTFTSSGAGDVTGNVIPVDINLKGANADAAGAEALIIFNQGNTPDRENLIVDTLNPPVGNPLTIPVLGASFADGAALAQARAGVVAGQDAPGQHRSVRLVGAEETGLIGSTAGRQPVAADRGISRRRSGRSASRGTPLRRRSAA